MPRMAIPQFRVLPLETTNHGSVVADTDKCGHAFEVRSEVWNNCRRECYRPLFARDVWKSGIAHQPVTFGINRSVQAVTCDRIDDVVRDIQG